MVSVGFPLFYPTYVADLLSSPLSFMPSGCGRRGLGRGELNSQVPNFDSPHPASPAGEELLCFALNNCDFYSFSAGLP